MESTTRQASEKPGVASSKRPNPSGLRGFTAQERCAERLSAIVRLRYREADVSCSKEQRNRRK